MKHSTIYLYYLQTWIHWGDYSFAAPGSNNGIKDAVNAIVLQAPDLDPSQLDKSIRY